jgi:protocatechuate 3,4-dioxygenase beta subunit
MKHHRLLIGWLLITLVVAVSTPAQPKCVLTASDMEGPFYKPGAPLRDSTGKGLVVSGIVRSADTCEPIANARIEWWQANPQGDYDDVHRGAQVTGASGAYRFDTDFPPPYYGRSSHIHFKAEAAGYRKLTTQLYPKRGQSAVAFDLVLAKE